MSRVDLARAADAAPLSPLGPDDPTPLQRSVLGWWRHARRDFPWRQTRDPWAVLLSELMLQQTQSGRVASRYPGLLARFPTAAACAAAGAGEVVAAWAGLGYNRRALSLHRAARAIVERHQGQVPDDLGALMALPGVGPYTARAVLAFAFERPLGVLETNTARVLARAVAGRRLARSEAQQLCDRMVDVRRPWEWNQALVDLGALRCVAGEPACRRCPLAGAACAWHAAGRPAPDPASRTPWTSGRQGRFGGSDRQGRGRLVAAARLGQIAPSELAMAAGWPDQPDRAARVAGQLVAEGLLRRTESGGVGLP